MIQLPLKASSGPTDLAGPLKRYLKKQASKNTSMWGRMFGDSGASDEHEHALDEFNDMRKRATTLGGDEIASLRNMARYYEQLCNAASRFPVGKKKSSGANVQFRWNGAFQKKTKKSFYSLFEERVVVLFNIAGQHTAVAVNIDRSDTKGLQDVARHFRIAAGTYQSIRKMIAEHDEEADAFSKVKDFEKEVLEMCEGLSLACAQSCFYEKAVAANMSPKTLAQLAMGCYKSYEAAASKAESASLSEWKSKIELQRYSFEAAGHFWKSKIEKAAADQEGSGYGVEVARLGTALDLLQKATDIADADKSDWEGKEDVMESVEKLKKKVKGIFDDALETNNSVYFDIVPDASELEEVDAKILAKPIPFDILNELDNKHSDDLFRAIVPPVVSEAAVEFASMLEKLVEETKASVRESGDMAKGTLASLGLPAALEADEGRAGMSDALCAKINSSRAQSGGMRGIEGKLMQAERSVETATSALERIRRALDEEAAEDSRYRRQHAHRWNRSRSDSVASSYRADLASYVSKVRGAKMANGRIRNRLVANRGKLALLEKTDAELNALFPAAVEASGDARASKERLSLQRLLVDVTKMLDKRDSCLKEIAEAAKSVDIVQIMTKRGAIKATESGSIIIRDKDTLFATELSKFDALAKEVKESVESQKGLIERIVNANATYQSARKTSSATKKREAVLQRIQIALIESNEIADHLREGVEFFQTLEDRIHVLESSVKDFASQRARDARDLSRDIASESGMVRGSSYASTSSLSPTSSGNVLEAVPVPIDSGHSDSYLGASSGLVAPPYVPPASTSHDPYLATKVPGPAPYVSDGGYAPPASSGSFDTSPPTYGGSTPTYGGSSASAPSVYDAMDATAGSSSSFYADSTKHALPPPSSSSSYSAPPPPSNRNEVPYYAPPTSATSTAPPSYGGSSFGSDQSLHAPPAYGGASTSSSSSLPPPPSYDTPSYGASSYGDRHASSGTTPPSYGSQSAVDHGPYAQQLATLAGMGFTDREKCLRALQSSGGDVQGAVASLFG